MILNEQYNNEITRKTQGRTITAAQKAYLDNQMRLLEKKHVVWDTCFGLYCFTMGKLNAALEDSFIELKDQLRPNAGIMAKVRQLTPQRGNQNKKQYEKFLNARIRKGIQDELGNYLTKPFPYYCQELNQAVKSFQEDFFEKWMNRHVSSSSGIVENTIDEALKQMKYDVTVLQTSVYNEMGRMRLPDIELKSRVYTFRLLSDMVAELHLGWMIVGPVPEWSCLNRSEYLDIYDRIKRITEHGEKSKHYDDGWKRAMNDGLSYQNVRYAGVICEKVVGKWTHQIGGMVDKAMEAIRRHITSTRALEELGNNAITETEDYNREREQLEQIDLFRNGDIPMTLLHFEAVRMMNEGKTNEEIHDWLSHDTRINITENKRVQILSTVEILRGMESGAIKPEYFNKGMAEAARHKDDDPEIDYGQLGLQAINDMGRAITEGLQEREEAEQQRRKEQSEHDKRMSDPLLRLSEKFNVKAMKKRSPSLPSPKGGGLNTSEPNKTPDVEAKQTTPDVEAKVETPDVEAKSEVPQMERIADPLPLTPQPPTPARKPTRWTPDEERYLEKSWGNVPMEDMQKHLWRTEASIRSKASRMFQNRKPDVPNPELPFNQ